MTTFTDKTPEDGYYEQYLGFFWEDKSAGPQEFTIDFQVSSEMEADFPGEESNTEWVSRSRDNERTLGC